MWLKFRKVVPEQLIFLLSFVLFMYLIFVQKMNSSNYELSLRVIKYHKGHRLPKLCKKNINVFIYISRMIVWIFVEILTMKRIL